MFRALHNVIKRIRLEKVKFDMKMNSSALVNNKNFGGREIESITAGKVGQFLESLTYHKYP
jgi:hypothetical protein